MSRKVVIAHGAATDVGQVRKVNEDSHVAEPPSSSSPTAWVATTVVTSPARW